MANGHWKLRRISKTPFLAIILFAAGGIARIFLSFQMRGTGFFLPTLISGILSLLLAGIIWSYAAEQPAVLLSLLGTLMGIEMLFNGVGLIFTALFVRGGDKENTAA